MQPTIRSQFTSGTYTWPWCSPEVCRIAHTREVVELHRLHREGERSRDEGLRGDDRRHRRQHGQRRDSPSRAPSGRTGLSIALGSSEQQRGLAEVVEQQAGSTSPYQAIAIGRRPKWPMSAYSASPPVTTRKMLPRARNALPGARAKKWTMLIGFIAPSTDGVVRGSGADPRTPRTANHTTITGPNTLPTAPVPRRWTSEEADEDHARRWGSRSSRTPTDATSKPSTALSTEIAGVMSPSP